MANAKAMLAQSSTPEALTVAASDEQIRVSLLLRCPHFDKLAPVMMPFTVLAPQESAEQRKRVRSEVDAGGSDVAPAEAPAPAAVVYETCEQEEDDYKKYPSDDEAKDASYEMSEEEGEDDDDFISEDGGDDQKYYGTCNRAAKKEIHKYSLRQPKRSQFLAGDSDHMREKSSLQILLE